MTSHALQHHVLQARSLGELTERITNEHGLFVPVTEAWQVMGFRTYAAARRAAASDKLGIPAVLLPGRRARVIRSGDLAEWLFEQYKRPTDPNAKINDKEHAH